MPNSAASNSSRPSRNVPKRGCASPPAIPAPEHRSTSHRPNGTRRLASTAPPPIPVVPAEHAPETLFQQLHLIVVPIEPCHIARPHGPIKPLAPGADSNPLVPPIPFSPTHCVPVWAGVAPPGSMWHTATTEGTRVAGCAIWIDGGSRAGAMVSSAARARGDGDWCRGCCNAMRWATMLRIDG